MKFKILITIVILCTQITLKATNSEINREKVLGFSGSIPINTEGKIRATMLQVSYKKAFSKKALLGLEFSYFNYLNNYSYSDQAYFLSIISQFNFSENISTPYFGIDLSAPLFVTKVTIDAHENYDNMYDFGGNISIKLGYTWRKKDKNWGINGEYNLGVMYCPEYREKSNTYFQYTDIVKNYSIYFHGYFKIGINFFL